MKACLRVVSDLETEKKIYEAKVQEASKTQDMLIVQALCFKKLDEYSKLTQLYLKFNNDKDVDYYLRGLISYKYLYNIGVPSERDINRIKAAFQYVQAESLIPATSEQEKSCRTLLSRLMMRATILEKSNAFNSLSIIGNNFRKTKDITAFRLSIRPFIGLLQYKDPASL